MPVKIIPNSCFWEEQTIEDEPKTVEEKFMRRAFFYVILKKAQSFCSAPQLLAF
jgi:hypothetical protein